MLGQPQLAQVVEETSNLVMHCVYGDTSRLRFAKRL